MNDILAWTALFVAVGAFVLAYLAYRGMSPQAELRPASNKPTSDAGMRSARNAATTVQQPITAMASARSGLAPPATAAVPTPTSPATENEDEFPAGSGSSNSDEECPYCDHLGAKPTCCDEYTPTFRARCSYCGRE